MTGQYPCPAVAGAPVSFGVFEMTPAGAPIIPPEEMLSILTESGYDGVDLGPVGYLGRGMELRERLARHGLELAGGWMQLPLSDDRLFNESLPVLHDALTVFRDALGGAPGWSPLAKPGRMPLPTLADAGSAARRAAPGRGAEVDALTDAAWQRLVSNAQRAADIVRTAGFEPTFHHHAGTYVESPDEIDRFLGATDIGLTLDIGHLAIAGGDPVEALHCWGSRVNHLHVKDVDRAILDRVLAAGGGMPEVWASGAFTALGRGDIDLRAVMDAVMAAGFDGWIVVEQDVLNPPGVDIAEFAKARAADQRASRDMLREWV